MDSQNELLIQNRITKLIVLVRNQRVLLDRDLAELYGVEVRRLNEQVKRNLERFPEDFMFQLNPDEWEYVQAQIALVMEGNSLRSQFATLKKGRGVHRKFLPYVFTEQGVAMLSSVLSSHIAIQVNISIMRVFVKTRLWAMNYQDLLDKINEMNARHGEHAIHIENIYKIIEELVTPALTDRKLIGFNRD